MNRGGVLSDRDPFCGETPPTLTTGGKRQVRAMQGFPFPTHTDHRTPLFDLDHGQGQPLPLKKWPEEEVGPNLWRK